MGVGWGVAVWCVNVPSPWPVIGSSPRQSSPPSVPSLSLPLTLPSGPRAVFTVCTEGLFLAGPSKPPILSRLGFRCCGSTLLELFRAPKGIKLIPELDRSLQELSSTGWLSYFSGCGWAESLPRPRFGHLDLEVEAVIFVVVLNVPS